MPQACSWILLALLTTTTRPIDYADPGPLSFRSVSLEWHDPARQNREIPVKIYLPLNQTAPAPIVIISHGLGGSPKATAISASTWPPTATSQSTSSTAAPTSTSSAHKTASRDSPTFAWPSCVRKTPPTVPKTSPSSSIN